MLAAHGPKRIGCEMSGTRLARAHHRVLGPRLAGSRNVAADETAIDGDADRAVGVPRELRKSDSADAEGEEEA